jgi:hypothetical protein
MSDYIVKNKRDHFMNIVECEVYVKGTYVVMGKRLV